MGQLTLDQFLAIGETEPASEYACGRAFQKPMPTREHSAIQIFLGALLVQFLARTPIGQAFTEFRCVFGPPGRQRTYVPDLCYVAHERLTAEQYLHAAPDLAVEILSPDQRMADFLDKMQFYLLYGVRLAWVIDPAAQSIAVLRPGHEARTLSGTDLLDGGDVLTGFTVAVDEIFARMRV